MKNPAPLFTYLCDVHDEFKKLVPSKVPLFTGWDAWVARRDAFSTHGSPEPHLSYNGRRHALALTMLYADISPAVVRDEVRGLDTNSLAVAQRLHNLIVGLAYTGIDYQPTSHEWARNRLLQNMALKVGNLFMIECLHALARETFNTPALLAERDGEYIYAYYDRETGCIADPNRITAKDGNDATLGMTIAPPFFMEAARVFARLTPSTEQLGRVTVALMHYGSVRGYKKSELIEVINLIADIESSDA